MNIKIKDDINVKNIREAMGLGIDAFASCAGVSRKTVERWEVKTSTPKGAARNLLILMRDYPELVKSTILNTIVVLKK